MGRSADPMAQLQRSVTVDWTRDSLKLKTAKLCLTRFLDTGSLNVQILVLKSMLVLRGEGAVPLLRCENFIQKILYNMKNLNPVITRYNLSKTIESVSIVLV